MGRPDFFLVEFYRDEDGNKPVAATLRAWTRSNPLLAARAKAELDQLRQPRYAGTANTRPIRGDRYRGLYELRIRGQDDARLMFFYASDRTIVVVHAFAKKSQDPRRSDLEVAHDRMRRHRQRQVGYER